MKKWLRRRFESWLNQHWYGSRLSWLAILLWPLSILMYGIVQARRYVYRRGWLTSYRSSVPVIVLGNITVGGTGKTPLVIAWVQYYQKQQRRVGVVARGYGASIKQAIKVQPQHSPAQVGDEPVMIYQRTGCPVYVCPKRSLAIQKLEQDGCEVIISDDGLQHYAFARDIEVALMDGVRRLGNGRLLPAGPLREPVSRLSTIGYQVCTYSHTGDHPSDETIAMVLQPTAMVPLDTSQSRMEPQALNILPVHAVTAMAHPQRFFTSLRALGYQIMEHAFPDHDWLAQTDLQFDDEYPIIMTHKDAVKLQKISDYRYYYLEVEPQLSQDLFSQINKRLPL